MEHRCKYPYNGRWNGLHMQCGIDEAGRGSVMGPLVVGAVFVESDDALVEIGVKDSKKLTPKRREKMYDLIVESAIDWGVVILPAEGVDEQRREMSLNEIELRMFAEAASKRPVDTICADCPDVNEEGFSQRFKNYLGYDGEIIVKHKADELYPVVSAASIVAKVTRDRMMDDIRKEFDVPIGSGYPSDHYTMDFIADWIQRNRCAPPNVRCSWEPVKVMLSKRANTKITEW